MLTYFSNKIEQPACSRRVDPDQTAPGGAICSGSTLFAMHSINPYMLYFVKLVVHCILGIYYLSNKGEILSKLASR